MRKLTRSLAVDSLKEMKSRLAPTPSGYLHLGNALNFVATSLSVKKAGGLIRLRIDDLDAPRARPDYIKDIFETLHWLGLEWDEGPKDAADHKKHYSQALRRGRYLEAVRFLLKMGSAFVCYCSRSHIKLKPCECRIQGHAFFPRSSVVRVVGKQNHDMGDFVIWRREGFAAYQLVSLMDDLDQGIDFIVRGEDLRSSTEAQLHLARLMGSQFGAERFLKVKFVHHPLLLASDGHKLSKSIHSQSLRELFPRHLPPAEVYRLLSPHLGFNEPRSSFKEMLESSAGVIRD